MQNKKIIFILYCRDKYNFQNVKLFRTINKDFESMGVI